MPETRTYTVTGMSCGHCEKAVAEEVSALRGVIHPQVGASAGVLSLTVEDGETVTDESVIAAVEEAGYQAVRSS
ncbi:heavy-metal-associated domain-containing protein [Nesterenkonia flava]|uniref:Heavy-metal-associated domain-containing protein n=1 Tax=Nesterenkonia flava TaxID=469799 RepID=A0ABU1FUS6_9MICC|nr:heavy-metal-associated domain-containing protein [Nesterenkonia flava]MDR5711911.1 heavy-metal-associated domain-containing protein [Nesterenkonia flava]